MRQARSAGRNRFRTADRDATVVELHGSDADSIIRRRSDGCPQVGRHTSFGVGRNIQFDDGFLVGNTDLN